MTTETAMARFRRTPVVVGLLLAVVLSACGGGDGDDLAANDFAPRYSPPSDAKYGGELMVLGSGDVDSLDPGVAQNQYAFMVLFATQRTLLTPDNETPAKLIPDIARTLPKVDVKAGTIEFDLRPGIRFSPPVSRPVVAADFEYAIERSLLPGVANGYVEPYLGSLRGFAAAKRQVERDPERAPDIAGVTALSPDRLELRFAGVVPPLAVDAFSLPFTSPVPAGYARKFDAEIPSTYAQNVVSSGPYMVPNDDQGALTGHRPGIEIELVRNPEWERSRDFRPAFLDRIRVESGFTNTGSASERILEGESQINGDFAPDPVLLERTAENHPDQLMMVPAGAILYAAMNTTIEPLNDVNVRRAIVAAADRVAMRLARGGAFVGPLATHFIPPRVPGFEQAGGLEGPGYDFLANPRGDDEVAAKYMRRAGYPGGRYTGDEELLMVTDTTGIGRKTGEVVKRAFDAVGIDVEARAVTQDIMYSRFCNVPAAEVAICPNVGWVRQLDDAQTVLDQTFNGNAILPVNNSNWPQLDVPAINRAIDRAKRIEDPEGRADAWGAIDRSITRVAPAIPIVWSEVPALSSENVVNVIDRANANPSLPMVSLSDATRCTGDSDC
ncbi:MAG TPA: ABC transporter substrate-binding protein [Solirubrobacterales bacterium]|nr:ABC transporter substrate-binding protein [Solirubrobacterales bacterium]